MRSSSSAYVAATTGDGRLIYLSATASPAQPGLEQALTEVLHELAKRSYAELPGDRARVDAMRMLRSMGFAVEELSIAVSYRCPQCAASIQLSPEIVVYVCPYCGWAGTVFGKSVRLLAWPAGRREDVEALIRRRGCTPVSIELRYLPFWVFEADVTADYVALVTYEYEEFQYYDDYHGRPRVRTRVVTRRRRVAGRVSFSATRAVLARLRPGLLGGGELKTWVESAWVMQPPSPLSEEEAKAFASSMLAPELDEGVARVRAEDAREDSAASRARRDAGRRVPGTVVDVRLLSFRPRITFKRGELVFAPYWLFSYTRGGSLYSGSAVGPQLSTLRLELPLSNAERALRLVGALLVSLVAGLAAELVVRVAQSLALLLMVAAMGLFAAAKLALSAYEPAKVE